MAIINVVPANDPAYTVDDNGAVHIILMDTANTYADGSNPKKDFIVIPAAQTMEALNQALILAQDDAVDYFGKEADKIAYRALVLLGMAQVSIPKVIFSGYPAGYTKTYKIGYNADEIIISDSLQIRALAPEIFEVTASVIGPNETRAQAKTVKIEWNINSGPDECRNMIIARYKELKSTPEDAIKTQLTQGIGTVLPE